jgi:glycosyl hydrolase family 26
MPLSRPRPGSASTLLAAVAIGAAAFVALAPLVSTPFPQDRRERASYGVYRGPLDPASVADFERWLGKELGWALEFLDDSEWTSIASPRPWLEAWNDSPYRVVYSVPLIPRTGGTLQEGASGAYNAHFAELAETLVQHGEHDAVLRLGWEFNGDWVSWTARDDPEAFGAYWRQVVDTMRGVPGARFEFDWCPNLGRGAMSPDLAYPGDEYVDYIGMDAYDVSAVGTGDPTGRWHDLLQQPYGLRWHRDFARAHRKPMTYPEWGLWLRSDGLGGGDNPYYVEKMRAWIEQNDVAYHMYFDEDVSNGEHRLDTGRFPRSQTVFRRLFGELSS